MRVGPLLVLAVWVTAMLANACARPLSHRMPDGGGLYLLTKIYIDRPTGNWLEGPQREAYEGFTRSLVEALDARGFIVVTHRAHAQATMTASKASWIALDTPLQIDPPRYSFEAELVSDSPLLKWRYTFEMNSRDLDADVDRRATRRIAGRLFDDWKMTAVRAGVVTPMEAKTLGFVPNGSQSSQQPTDTDYDWVWQVYTKALDALMPMKLKSRQVVAYRSDHDFLRLGEIERHFTISYADGLAYTRSDFSATIVTPMGRSIQRQLLDLHMADRKAAFDVILARVSVRRLTLDSSRCPVLGQRLDALADVTITFPFRDRSTIRIFTHPIAHRLVIRSDSLTLNAAENDQESPLVRWALQSSADLAACGQQQ